MTTAKMAKASTSWTNVAPVRQLTGKNRNHFKMKPGRQHDQDRSADKDRVELLARD